MIKPRYIKSLTFLLLCNMALPDRKHSSSFSWFGFGPFFFLGVQFFRKIDYCSKCPGVRLHMNAFAPYRHNL